MHTAYIIATAIVGLTGVTLGIVPSVITWTRRRRRQTRTSR